MALFQQKQKIKEKELEAPSPYPAGGDIKDEIKKQKIEESLDFPRYSPITLTEAESFSDMEDMEGPPVFNAPRKGEKQKIRPAAANEVQSRDQSLFIKIDRYNELIELIAQIKRKLSNADGILRQIDHIKTEEEKELKSWQSELVSIKEGLVAIDEKLFEA